MKRIALFLLVACLSSVWAAGTAPAPLNAEAASAPSIAVKPAGAASAPSQSPAVRAADNAVLPGKVRPESAVVPQLTVPLRPGATRKADAGPPSEQPSGTVDQRAARCAAIINKDERLRCETAI